MLRITELCKSMGGRRVVDGFSFELPPGERMAVVGPPGVGKSALLALVAGLLHPDRGSIVVGNFDMRYQPAQAKRRVGYVPQETPTVAPLSVDEYLRLLAELYGLAEQEFVQRSAALAWLRDDRSPRRTRLLGALLPLPSLLLIDEPRGWPAEDLAALQRAMSEVIAEGGAVLVATREAGAAHGLQARVRTFGELHAVASGGP